MSRIVGFFCGESTPSKTTLLLHVAIFDSTNGPYSKTLQVGERKKDRKSEHD